MYRNDVGQWTISKHLTDPYGFIRKKWKGNLLPSGKKNWLVRKDGFWESAPGLNLTPKKEKGEDFDEELILISLFALLVVILVGIAAFVYMRKRKAKNGVEPEVAKNVVYGDDDEFCDEHNNRVEVGMIIINR